MDASAGFAISDNISRIRGLSTKGASPEDASRGRQVNPQAKSPSLPIRHAPIDPANIPRLSRPVVETIYKNTALFTGGYVLNKGLKSTVLRSLGGAATATAFAAYSVAQNWQGLSSKNSHLRAAAGLNTVVDIGAGAVAFQAGLIAGKVGVTACSWATPVGGPLICGGGLSVIVGSGTYAGLSLVKYTSLGDYIRKEETQGNIEEKLQQLGIKLVVKNDNSSSRDEFFGQVRLEVRKGLRITEGQLFDYYLGRLVEDKELVAKLRSRKIEVKIKNWDNLTPARFEPILNAVSVYLALSKSPKRNITIKASVDAHQYRDINSSWAVDEEGYFIDVNGQSFFGVTKARLYQSSVGQSGATAVNHYRPYVPRHSRDYGRL